MKNIFFFISLLFCFHAGFSQDFDAYDKNWATYFGGQGTRFTTSVIDSEGNLIAMANILGDVSSILEDEEYYNQFITTQDPQFTYNSNLATGFNDQTLVAKFSPEGDLLKAVYLPFYVYKINIDANDHIFISGFSEESGLGTPDAWFPNPHDELVNLFDKTILAKLNLDFSTQWLTYTPTNGAVFDFALDDDGNFYGVSYTNIQTGITTPNTFQPNFMVQENSEEQRNGYFFKLNHLGELQWASYYGFTTPGSLAYDGNAEIIGSFKAPVLAQYEDYYLTADAYQQTPTQQVISKFNTNTGQRSYSTYLDDTLLITSFTFYNNFIYCSAYVFNTLIDDNLISPDAYQTSHGGMLDVYLGKFTSRFTPIWGTYMGGSEIDYNNLESEEIRVKNDAIYITGITGSNGFINSTNTYQSTLAGSSDIFMMKFSLDGELTWGSYFGGNEGENYSSISVVNDSIFYLVGDTFSLENISTPESHQEEVNFHPSTTSGYNMGNGYIAKFGPEEGLSIGDVLWKDDFSVYPNPSIGKVNIVGNSQTPIEYIEVFSATGKTVLEKEVSNLEEHQLDLSFLAKGVYFLKVNHAASAKKLILK
ncbi:T9SS type A sorting domain-containing protein [Mesonia sp. MT50]|uniref:T9SS type A sorting domain-containing protein n=1 Tax=Mesonia profundi TaxID=3070998 RepID=A0ABU1A439_9FLAO|nr:T9SS type A sorting domain-containing protein [Mesonia profundi]MDQ7918400.1 T9SS type A sorting domain-containing protein [Mesonia profundi]